MAQKEEPKQLLRELNTQSDAARVSKNDGVRQVDVPLSDRAENMSIKLPHMSDIFRDFLEEVEPIKFKEPLAETLGAFKEEGVVLEYTFTDVVKLAGHACPTTAGAYLSCQKALEKLYPDEIPVRGEISVTVYGEPDEGVYGVMAQVFGFLTGAASATGFRGLGHKFKRKDLLKFNPGKVDPQAMSFEFRRLDNGKAVLVKFYPQQIPFPEEKFWSGLYGKQPKRRRGKSFKSFGWER
jgi:hypothetical protein